MIAALLIALIVLGLPTLYFARRSREFRFIVHFILFGLCLYFGFVQKPKDKE
jgi:hypothetical protein